MKLENTQWQATVASGWTKRKHISGQTVFASKFHGPIIPSKWRRPCRILMIKPHIRSENIRFARILQRTNALWTHPPQSVLRFNGVPLSHSVRARTSVYFLLLINCHSVFSCVIGRGSLMIVITQNLIDSSHHCKWIPIEHVIQSIDPIETHFSGMQ